MTFNPSEGYEQERLAAWLEDLKIPEDAYTAIPLGEKRDAITAAKLKRQGVKRGAPDILFYTHPPIALELKRQKGGRVSPEQAAVHERCRRAGWTVLVCHGAEAAKSALLQLPHFLGLFRNPSL